MSEPSEGFRAPAAVAETHISVVVFVGDRAYKLKKPVRFGFLDFSTRQLREAACRREVELNRRLAPDVYLGVADVSGVDGQVADHLVVMRRMPADRRLSALVAGGDPVPPALRRELRRLGRVLAAFHADAERGPAIDAAATVEAVAALWRDNFAELAPFAGVDDDAVVAADDVARASSLVEAFVAGRASLFADRIGGGHVVDGHGDLQCDDVFVLDDGPRVLDCIEFNDVFRWGDTAADLAFLVMDLERRGAPEAARILVEAYEEFAGDRFPPPLLHHYVAYRAQVRAKVAALRAGQTEPGSPARAAAVAEARALLRQCLEHLDAARVRLVMVGGLPGTGKSTLAAGLGRRLDATVLRSDEVRKELAGLDPTDRAEAGYGEGLYAGAVTDATYEALARRTGALLGAGESVVLDASWASADRRMAVRAVAEACSAELVELRCVLEPAEAERRIEDRRARGTDPSDATAAVADAMAAEFAPWPEAVEIDAFRRERALGAALVALGVDR